MSMHTLPTPVFAGSTLSRQAASIRVRDFPDQTNDQRSIRRHGGMDNRGDIT